MRLRPWKALGPGGGARRYPELVDAAPAVKGIRDLLWEWDFIGVRGVGPAWPDDDYDCRLGPLHGRLVHGADADAIREYLRSELSSHFGVEPTPSLDLFVEKLMSWWSEFPRTDA